MITLNKVIVILFVEFITTISYVLFILCGSLNVHQMEIFKYLHLSIPTKVNLLSVLQLYSFNKQT